MREFMKKYMFVKTETLEKLVDCFASAEEMQNFIQDLHTLMHEIHYSSLSAVREGTEHFSLITSFKQIIQTSIFFKDNIEILQQTMRCIEFREATESERRNYEDIQRDY